MWFIDLNTGELLTLLDLKQEWEYLHEVDEEHQDETFLMYVYDVLMATISDRNDLEIRGMMSREVGKIIFNLRKSFGWDK